MGDAARNIRHVERILYISHAKPFHASSRDKKSIQKSEMRALEAWYKQNGIKAKVSDNAGISKARLMLPNDLKASIIIPSDNFDNIVHCVKTLINKTQYPTYEVIVVTNSKVATRLAREFSEQKKLKLCTFDKPYNFSEKCNAGAAMATGDALCFYNDDIYPINKDWLNRVLEVLILPGVGGVTPFQMSEDNTILNAGFVLGTPALHTFAYQDIDYSASMNYSPYHTPHVIRDVSALSGACVIIRKSIFEEIGMFDSENTPTSFSDTDISVRLRESGYRCVNTPYAKMLHENRISWARLEKPDKAFTYMMRTWGKYLTRDPYFTDSMKAVYSIAPPPELFKYHAPQDATNRKPDGRDIMLVSHEFSLSGAPFVLLDMARIVLENGDWPVVVSPFDGPLRQKCLDMGITVIIDNSLSGSSPSELGAFECVARNFDLVIVNTLVSGRAIKALSYSLPPVLWWIHESPISLRHLRHTLPDKLSANIKAYAPTNISANALNSEGLSYNLDRLVYGVTDYATQAMQKDYQKNTTFLLIANIQYRKGHDILMKALNRLDNSIIKKTRFILIGSPVNYTPQDPETYEICLASARKFGNIEIYGDMPREDLMEWYNKADCLLIPSREDPLPVVGLEAAVHSLPIICSDNVGETEYITHKRNGFIFPNEDHKALAELITFAAKNRKKLAQAGNRARKEIYEEHFTMEKFRKKALKTIDKVIQARSSTAIEN
jgi:glycosyltransferase involved in cell wall biosynthesis